MLIRALAADTLLENLTVYEQLLYTSELKNHQKESLARKRERVEIVLDQLALAGCRDITIGSALRRGISGELHSSPRVACCCPRLEREAAHGTNAQGNFSDICAKAIGALILTADLSLM